MRYGYCRVSSESQSVDIQVADLNLHAVEHIRVEKQSARSMEKRDELQLLLEFVRQGDELWVTRIDRLARSTLDLCQIVDTLERKGVVLKCTQQPIDTSTPMGRMMIQLLGIFAEFELEIRKERQLAGIIAARARGAYRGRPKSFKQMDIVVLARTHPEWGPTRVAEEIGCSVDTVQRAYRALGHDNMKRAAEAPSQPEGGQDHG
jgi:DNA invertase Pin-like site-specific DNA recombinase